jgi:hypothetical protein
MPIQLQLIFIELKKYPVFIPHYIKDRGGGAQFEPHARMKVNTSSSSKIFK